MSRNDIHYSAPGEYAGIRQHEHFGGELNNVDVHPSYPAIPEHTQRYASANGWRHSWRTSSRKAAVALASRDRDLHPTRVGDAHGYGRYPAMIERLIASAQTVTMFLATYYGGGNSVDTDGEGYDDAAETMFESVRSIEPGQGPGQAWACALGLKVKDRAPHVLAQAARELACYLGSALRRYSRIGYLPYVQAYGLTEDMERAVGWRE